MADDITRTAPAAVPEAQPPAERALKVAAEPVARIDLLEGTRGVLACWVMIGHFTLYLGGGTLLKTAGDTWLGKAAFLAMNGDVPVCLFMVISGFVISNLLQSRREPYGIYITRRFLRLFPAMACCLTLGILVSHWQSSVLPGLPWAEDTWVSGQVEQAVEHRHYAALNILAHLPMIHGMIPPSFWPYAPGAFLGPGWSISTEWQFYLVAPLLLAAARKPAGLALVCLGVGLAQIVYSKLRLGAAVDNYNGAFLGFYIQYFFIGGLSYFAWRLLRRMLAGPAPGSTRLQGLVLCGAAISFFMLVPVLFGLLKGQSLTPFLPLAVLAIWLFLFACLCQIMAAPGGWEARLVESLGCSRFILFLGKISYSIYLVHFPLGVVFLRFSGPLLGMPRPAFVALYFVLGSLLTIGVAALLYRYVEAPAIDWAKQRFRQNRDRRP